MSDDVTIRFVTRDDYAQWLPLWDGYNAFYERSGPTALAPEIGYDKAADLSKEAYKTGRTIREVARETPDAIAVVCTNMRAAPLVARLELETGIPILDTIATVVWKSLKLAGVDTRGASEWGSLFQKFA